MPTDQQDPETGQWVRAQPMDFPPYWYQVLWHRIKLAFTPRAKKHYVRLRILDAYVNYLQRKSIEKLINRAKYAHHTDIVMRINGKDEVVQADWLKHLLFDRQERPRSWTSDQ